ncbi:MAG: hypothetical protein ACLGHO_06495 [Gammaproteobacteria bacterium]
MAPRLPVALLLIVALFVNGVWHVAHADFHPPAEAAVTDVAPPAKHTNDMDHSGDTLVHPLHQQAYLYRVEIVPPSLRVERMIDDRVARSVTGHASRLFRPPAS